MATHLVTHLLGDIVRTAIFLTECSHQLLELRRHVLLFLGIFYIRLLEPALIEWCLLGHLLVDFLLAFRVIQLSTLLTFLEEQVHLDVIVGQTLLSLQSPETRDGSQHKDHARSNECVLLVVLDTQPLELQVMMHIETVHQCEIDGEEPGKTCQSVEDTSQTALLTRHTGQLTISTVKDITPHQQEDTDEIINQSQCATIIEAALCKEPGTGGTDNHRPDGDGIGVDVKLSEEYRTIIAKGTDDMQV